MWFSAYHGDGNATLRFKPARIRNYLLVGPGIFAVPAKGRRATKWRKGFYSNPESYHESACPFDDDAGSTCKTLGLRNWNSDYGKNPSDAVGATFPYRNHEIPIFLKRGFNRALRFGISEGSQPGALCIGIIGYGVRYKAEERGVAVLRR